MGVASAVGPVARNPLLGGFVACSLYTIVNLYSKGDLANKANQCHHGELHVHGVLLTDIARMLQTAVVILEFSSEYKNVNNSYITVTWHGNSSGMVNL